MERPEEPLRSLIDLQVASFLALLWLLPSDACILDLLSFQHRGWDDGDHQCKVFLYVCHFTWEI